MNIFEVFNFFKDATLVDISIRESLSVLPNELTYENGKWIETYIICIDNYSNETINKVTIQCKSEHKFKPIILDEDENEVTFSDENKILTVINLYPKSQI